MKTFVGEMKHLASVLVVSFFLIYIHMNYGFFLAAMAAAILYLSDVVVRSVVERKARARGAVTETA